METYLQEVRHAIRSLHRSTAYSLTSVVLIGSAVAGVVVFATVLWSVVVRPLPYKDSENLAVLAQPDGGPISGRVFHYLRENSHVIEAIAAQSQPTGWNVNGAAKSEYLRGYRISAKYFETLGAQPLIGREFSESEERPGGPRSVILSEAAWKSLFDADSSIIGRAIELGGAKHEIVGVMPADLKTFPDATLWVPLQLAPNNNSWSFRVIGRLRPGQTYSQAQFEYQSLAANAPWSTQSGGTGNEGDLRWSSYRQYLTGQLWTPLLLLLGAAGCLLMIACSNVAALSVVRANARQREMAARVALGASRAQLFRMVAAESVVLSIFAGVLAVVLSDVALRVAKPTVPEQLLAGRDIAIGIESGVLSVALSFVVFVVCCLFPATAHAGAASSLLLDASDRRYTTDRRSMWFRRAMVAAQFAAAVALLVTSSLLIKTFGNLRSVNVGFEPRNVIVGEMSLQGIATKSIDETRVVFDRVLTKLSNLPAVTKAAVSTGIPVERGLNMPLAPIAGGAVPGVKPVDWRYVSTNYFDVFGISLKEGRLLAEQDNAAGRPIAIVSESFARQFLSGQAVIGQVLGLVGGMGKEPQREIVGIVADVKGRSGAGRLTGGNAIVSDAPAVVYVPFSQMADAMLSFHSSTPISWSVKVSHLDGALAHEIERTVLSELPTTPMIRSRPMTAILGNEIAADGFRMTLVTTFAIASSILAAVGLYSLLSFVGDSRKKEIGIKMALGAERWSVVKQFASEALANSLVGVVAGIALTFATASTLKTLLWGVAPFDAKSYATALVWVALLTISASVVPAWRASKIDPATTLRE